MGSTADRVVFALDDAMLAGLSPECREYAAASPVLLRKAERSYASGEPLEACIYAWGAAEDITKAVAENWKDYGVTHQNERDLWALMHGLLPYDSPMVAAAAAICESELPFAEQQAAIKELVANQSSASMHSALDSCYRGALNLRECFYEDRFTDYQLEHGLPKVANYINRMLYWLRQPHPPVGFRQHQWQEPFAHPDETAGVATAPASKEAMVAVHTGYWVYENYPNKKAVVHRSDCRHCQDGLGTHGTGNTKNGVWHGPFTDADSALAKATSTHRANIRTCSICRP